MKRGVATTGLHNGPECSAEVRWVERAAPGCGEPLLPAEGQPLLASEFPSLVLGDKVLL